MRIFKSSVLLCCCLLICDLVHGAETMHSVNCLHHLDSFIDQQNHPTLCNFYHDPWIHSIYVLLQSCLKYTPCYVTTVTFTETRYY